MASILCRYAILCRFLLLGHYWVEVVEEERVLTIVPPDGIKNYPLRSIYVDVVAVLLFLILAEVVFLRPVSVAFLFF